MVRLVIAVSAHPDTAAVIMPPLLVIAGVGVVAVATCCPPLKVPMMAPLAVPMFAT